MTGIASIESRRAAEDDRFLKDESKMGGGYADTVFFPENEAEISAVLKWCAEKKLKATVAGGGTGITGAAVPFGGVVISMEKFNNIIGLGFENGRFFLKVQAAVTLSKIAETLRMKETSKFKELTENALRSFEDSPDTWCYPVDPTEMSAQIGGTAATNASGAATYRFGPTRNWIKSLVVTLPDGNVQKIERGKCFADASGEFDFAGKRFKRCAYEMPDCKNAAGLYSKQSMDIIDLFIGSEGILGVISELEIWLEKKTPSLSVVQFFHSDSDAFSFVKKLKKSALSPDFIEFIGESGLDLIDSRIKSGCMTLDIPEFRENQRSAVFFDISMDKNAAGSLEKEASGLIEHPEDSWCAWENSETERIKAFRHAVPESYDFYFYCDSTASPCAKAHPLTTLAPPFEVPACVDFDTFAVGLAPQFWSRVTGNAIVTDSVSHSDDNSLMVLGTIASPDIDIDSLQEISLGLWVMTTEPGARLLVGSMGNPADVATFHNLKTIVPEQPNVWEHHFVSFANAPTNAHFIALRNSAGDSRTLFVDDMHFTPCAAFDLHIDHLDNNSLDLSWNSVGTPTVSFTVDDNGTLTNYTTVGDTLSLPITPLHNYTIAMHATCTSPLACNVDYDDTIHIVAPVEGTGCVNSTDLHSPQAVFYSGSYQNPYSVAGPVDRGSRSPDSRHTVCYDTTERDPRTEGMLRTIPEGYTSSVRLGNWSTEPASPEAEGVIYSLLIDTMSFNLLMMRYAAVLQDPMHDVVDQPRFRLELLDSAFNLIDPVCAAADFIANRNLGWNEAPDNVLWKDWTPVGIDVSAYAGQQVYVRLTTYDCNEGSHYGYAYFTLECMRKTIDAETCGNVDSNRFVAPAGFAYRWYTATSPATISTERTLVVPTAAMETYYCDLSFVGNAACNFTLSAYGGPRLPLARVDTTVTITDCHFDVQFTNTSTVSPDGINPAPTNEQVETAYWDFGNGETSNSYHGHTVYDTIGTYTVTLIVGISGGNCTDTLVWPMRVEPPTWPYIVGPDSLCDGAVDTLRLYGGIPYNDTLWSNGGDHWYLPISQANYQIGSNNYALTTTDPYGCHPPASHTLIVSPIYQFYDTLRICNPLLPYNYRDTMFSVGTLTGDYDLYYHSAAGCDSNYHLWLSVNDSAASTFRDTVVSSICDNENYSFHDSTFSAAGTYSLAHVDAVGSCDSIHTLHLSVRATSTADTTADECDSFTWYDSTYTVSTNTPTHIISNTVGCDSTTTLHLTIRNSSASIVDESVLENQLPYTYNNITFTSDTDNVLVTLPNAVGCDSLITYSLLVHWNSLTNLDSTICADLLPFAWQGLVFTGTGVQDDTLTGMYGEDSIVRMSLMVNPVYDDTLDVSICDNQSFLFVDSNYTDAGVYTRLLSSVAGCDSLCTLQLDVRATSIEDTVATVCDSIVWHGTTYTASADSLTASVGLNHVACDSTLRLALTVHYSSEVNDSIIICPGYPFLYQGVDYGGPTAFDAMFQTRELCDSLVHVYLLARDSNYRIHALYRFDSSDWQMPDSVLKSCDPTLLELRDSTDGAIAWNWSCIMADTVLLSIDTFLTVAIDTGQDAMMGYISLIVADTLGCFDTVGWPLFVFQSSVPEFQWHPDVPAMHNPETQFENHTWPDTSSYLWRIQQQEGGAFDTTSEVNPFYHWGNEGDNMIGEYTVRLIASWPHTVDSFRVDTVQWIDSALRSTMLYETFTHTCVDSVEHTVVITNDYLQFPNLVTPDDDGINDTWQVVNLIEFGNYSMNELWIYDRTGALVYHAKNIRHEEQFWDPNATRSPDGTYYYRFTAKGEYGLVKRNGVIEVLRKQ